jgi:hypothetical protein
MKHRVIKRFEAWRSNPPESRWIEVGTIIHVYPYGSHYENGDLFPNARLFTISEADGDWETTKQYFLACVEPIV